MKVKEFLSYVFGNLMYAVVDATKSGYLSEPQNRVMIDADRYVVKDRYGNCELKGFVPKTKNILYLYVIPEVTEDTFIDDVLDYIKEGKTDKLPAWAKKMFYEQTPGGRILDVYVSGDECEITADVYGDVTRYVMRKDGFIGEK